MVLMDLREIIEQFRGSPGCGESTWIEQDQNTSTYRPYIGYDTGTEIDWTQAGEWRTENESLLGFISSTDGFNNGRFVFDETSHDIIFVDQQDEDTVKFKREYVNVWENKDSAELAEDDNTELDNFLGCFTRKGDNT